MYTEYILNRLGVNHQCERRTDGQNYDSNRRPLKQVKNLRGTVSESITANYFGVKTDLLMHQAV